jgi:TRAP-type C4-dicarboxylate transport system permease small subunit
MFRERANWVVDWTAALVLLFMAGIVALQIFCRYVLNRPLFWPEEMSVFLFVWLIWVGGATGMREERQIRVDFFEQFFPERLKNFFTLFNTVLSIVYMILVVFYGVKVAVIQMTAEYDSLPFSRGVLYSVAPIVGTLMAVYLTGVLIRQIKRIRGVPSGNPR